MSETPLEILHLEDSDLDAELIGQWLQKCDRKLSIDRVVDRDSFTKKLQSNTYALILSDYQVPTFTGLEALEIARRYQPQTPFVFVSGIIGEEFAVETLRAGATDYILKDRLIRLPAAVERALTERHERDIRLAAEHAVQESEDKFRWMANTIPNLAWMANADGKIFWFNDRWYEYTGTTLEQMQGMGWQCVHDPIVLPTVTLKWQQCLETGEPFEMVFPLLGADGVYRPFLTRMQMHRDADGKIVHWFGTSTDISTQKQAEEQLLKLAERERHRAEVFDRLIMSSRKLNSILSLNSTLAILAEEARQILDADIAVVKVIDSRQPDQPIEATASRPETDGQKPGAASIVSAAPVEVAILNQIGRRIGSIAVFAKHDDQFRKEDEPMLQQLAAIATVSIENSRLYEALRDQDRRKDEFLATLSHELRNPLAPLRNGMSILRREPSPNQAEILEMMNRQLTHMVRLVDDLLEVSRITSGKIKLQQQNVLLQEIIAGAVETSKPFIDAHHHKLDVRICDDELLLNVDKTRMAQVVTNLLNNAAKYTPPGGTIVLSAQHTKGCVTIEVADSGIGIPREMLSRIFDIFTQVGSARERSQGGLGIGLTLVRRLVEMHNGTVRAESDGIGTGSRFIVQLPLVEEHGSDAITHDSPKDQHRTNGVAARRILVVDDNVDSAKSLAMILSLQGHQVKTAHDGPEALAEAKKFNPTVVLLDLGLPGMNGYEVAQSLRAEPDNHTMKIVAVTGWGSIDDRRRSKAVGFDHHLTKPVDCAALDRLLAE